MGKKKKALKKALRALATPPDQAEFQPYREVVKPVPVHLRCIFTGDDSWAVRCSHRADFLLDHEEFDPDDLPQYCHNHIGLALLELIEPGCGIDELTILRSSP